MAKCLILGSSGVLANCLAQEMTKFGLEVFGLSRSISSSPEYYSQQEISNFSKQHLMRSIRAISPDIVINTIAETNLQICQTDIERAIIANIQIPKNLADCLSELSYPPYTVQISTDNVYSDPGFSIENQTRCVNNYGFSKLLGEYAFVGRQVLVLRTNYLARTSRAKSYMDWVLKSLSDGIKVNLYKDVHFNPTSVENMALNIIKCYQANVYDTINLGVNGAWTKESFFHDVANLTKQKTVCRSVKCPQIKVTRPLDMRMDLGVANSYGLSIETKDNLLQKLLEGEVYDF